jgi:branched-chain amino acid transport system ATP-binding protein
LRSVGAYRRARSGATAPRAHRLRRRFAEIRALKAEGVTILLVEQGVDFSLALADRVYILGKDSIRHIGPAAELRDDTALRDRLLAL